MDEVSKKNNVCEGDAFRNLLAFHFGKFYFENSVDSVWRRDIGDWGKLSVLEQDLMNMTGHWHMFKFYSAQFGVDDNSGYCLELCFFFYNKILDRFTNMMKQLKISSIQFTPYFFKGFKRYSQNDSIAKIVSDILIEQYDCFNKIALAVRK